MVCSFSDITAQKQAETDLRATQARLVGILDIAEDAIIVTNEAQQISRFNQGAERIFGYTAHEVIGRPLDLLLPTRVIARHGQHIRDFAASADVAWKMGERRDIYGRRRDGSEFPAEASISKLVSDAETVFTVFLRDISEQKRAEEVLKTFATKAACSRSAPPVKRSATTKAPGASSKSMSNDAPRLHLAMAYALTARKSFTRTFSPKWDEACRHQCCTTLARWPAGEVEEGAAALLDLPATPFVKAQG